MTARNSPAPPPEPSEAPELPAPWGRTILFCLIALTISISLVAWIKTVGGKSYPGYVGAHTIAVYADRDCVLKAIVAREGAFVAEGDALVVLADEQLESRLVRQRNRVAELKDRLKQLRAQADVDLTWRLKSVETDVHRLRLQSAAFLKDQHDQRFETHAWQDVLDGTERDLPADLHEPQNLVFRSVTFERRPADTKRVQALLRKEAAVNATEVSTAQVEMCRKRLAELERLRSELPAKVRRGLGIDALEARLDEAAGELKHLEQQPREVTIKSPGYGTVGVYRRNVGEKLAPGDPIVELLDGDRRFVTAHIPSARLADFAEGADVQLRFPGRREPRTGRVERVPPQVIRRAGSHDEAPRVPVRIVPTGKLWPDVPIGSAVDVLPGEGS